MERIGRAVSLRKVAFLVALLVAGLSAAASAESAQDAKKTSGVIYAGPTHQEGDDLYVSGDFKDKLLGRGAIVYVTNLEAGDDGTLLVKAQKVTIYTRKGSLTGKGQATQDPVTGEVTDGTFKLDKGTGAYKGHQLKGTFDGTLTEGVYTFKYQGKYR